mgnify:CR=1 FL=1
MIGKRHFRTLETVGGPTTRQELVNSLEYTPKTITNILGDLESLGLITRERSGSRVTVRPANARCVNVFHTLVRTKPHIDFPDLLSESTLVLLYHLSKEPIRGPTLVDRSQLSRATVYRHLDKLLNRAIVLKDGSRYWLAKDFVDLHTFAVELSHQRHRRQLEVDDVSGALVWESHDEFLLQTDDVLDIVDYHRTGLAMFAEYDLQFFTTPGEFYYYAPGRDSLDALDLVCHLLMIENDSRHRQYAMLLIAKEGLDREELLDRADYYRTAEIVEPLTEYVRSEGDTASPNLPPWEEFKSLATDYGVDL